MLATTSANSGLTSTTEASVSVGPALCASSGSACSAGSLEPSHVLRAMGVSPAEANALVRLTLGRDSTEAELERVLAVLPDVLGRLRGE
jgi:cysteine desulfurase